METLDITMPYLNVPKDAGFDIMRLPQDEYDAKRIELVSKCYATTDVDFDSVPILWMESPLTAWCWLVLTVNDLDPDPLVHKSLLHWGIDLSFASNKLNCWIWAIS